MHAAEFKAKLTCEPDESIVVDRCLLSRAQRHLIKRVDVIPEGGEGGPPEKKVACKPPLRVSARAQSR